LEIDKKLQDIACQQVQHELKGKKYSFFQLMCGKCTEEEYDEDVRAHDKKTKELFLEMQQRRSELGLDAGN